jgi:hypothetical protein
VKATQVPSGLISASEAQSYQDRRFSPGFPRWTSTMSCRQLCCVTSSVPSGAMSSSRRSDTFWKTSRSAPWGVTAQIPFRPSGPAVNQISVPFGAQASPSARGHCLVSFFTFPALSTSITSPLSSGRTGWWMKATASPEGETRGWVIQPPVS